MTDFSTFDTRHYRTVDAATGYDGWSATYEDTVLDAMDLALLERLSTGSLEGVHAADLGCGTGRTGAWLRGRGARRVDGVDVSEGMLERAWDRGAHDSLARADVRESGLSTGAHDVVVASLVDEHLPDLAPLYTEAARVARPGGRFLMASYHPHFAMVSGMPTHYTDAAGEHVAITTHVHLLSDHVRAALAAGWRLADMVEGTVDDTWVAAKPKWERYRGHPVSLALAWTLPA